MASESTGTGDSLCDNYKAVRPGAQSPGTKFENETDHIEVLNSRLLPPSEHLMPGTIGWVSSRSDVSDDDEAPVPSAAARTKTYRPEKLPAMPYPGPVPLGRAFGAASKMTQHQGPRPSPGPGPATDPPQTKPLDDKQRIKAIRDELLDARLDMMDQRQSHQRLRDWERHAREKLVKQLSVLDLPKSVKNTFGELQHAVLQLNQEEERTRALEKRLTSLEYRLDKELDQQEAKVEDSLECLPYDDIENDHSTSSSTEGQPSLLREFINRRADIPILLERFNNLEIDYGEERTARETRANLGQPLSLPDIDFYDEHNQQRHSLRQNLLKTEAEVEELRRRCAKEGLMPESNESKEHSRAVDQSSDTRSARNGLARHWYRLPFSEVNTVINRSMALMSTRLRVNEWLNQVLRATGIELLLSQHHSNEPNDRPTSYSKSLHAPDSQKWDWEEIDESEAKSFPSTDPLRTLDRFSWPAVHKKRVHRRHSDSLLFLVVPKLPAGWNSAHSL